MSWSEVTITQSGERILSRMLNGAKLIFTRVVIGSETVNEQALPAQTSVFVPIDAPALIAGKAEIEGKNGTQIKIQIRNDGVTETTRMKQIGLYAKTEHDDEVLFGILQDEIGEEIPTFADFSQFLIELWAVVAISRTNNIQIAESPLVYVTVEHLMKVQNELETKIEESTSDLPKTGLGDIKDTADVKEVPTEGDYIPIIDSDDGGQMKKTPFAAFNGGSTKVIQAVETAIAANDKAEQAINTADSAALAAKSAIQTANEVKKQLDNFNTLNVRGQKIIIPVDGWVQSDPEEYNGLSVDVPVEDVTEDMIPLVALSPKEGKRASKCKMFPGVKSGDGYIRFYAESSPSEPINASATFLLVSSGTVSSGRQLLPASADRLGGVKIGENINISDDGTISVNKESLIGDITATDKESQEIINKYFNN